MNLLAWMKLTLYWTACKWAEVRQLPYLTEGIRHQTRNMGSLAETDAITGGSTRPNSCP